MSRYTVTAHIGERTVKVQRPTPYAAIDLLDWFRRTANQGDALEFGEDSDANFAVMREKAALTSAAWGRLLGRMVLDSPQVSGNTPEEYGLAVWLAYCEAGWTDAELEALGSACVDVLVKCATFAAAREDVKVRLDFGEAPAE